MIPLFPSEAVLPADFILLTPEAYVDHPSFGHAVIARLIEAAGFNIVINSQPLCDADYTKFGSPKIAFLISGGVVDSMVNNYTVSKKKRGRDVYSEGGAYGKRPDRAVTVYCKNLKRLFPDVPVVIGGIEASLRRMAHYDYWADKVMPSVLVDSGADLLMYGMGERSWWQILDGLKKGVALVDMKEIPGTAYLSSYGELPESIQNRFKSGGVENCPSYEEVCRDNLKYIKAFKLQENSINNTSSKYLAQKHGDKYVIVTPPPYPLSTEEMDTVYALPFERRAHPSYTKGVPALTEVSFSITAHRGCFGNCAFCALTYHQGRVVSARSDESIIAEAKKLTEDAEFKGYIHDVGGCTANFHAPACKRQSETGSACADRQCIGYERCQNLIVDHTKYLELLRKLRALPKVKKVFIRSGIRFDYLMMDSDRTFFRELIAYHVSGQLKVAPEHCVDKVLKCMNKPPFAVYESFSKEFKAENEKQGLKQYLVPYLISSHPSCEMKDALALTKYLKSVSHVPEQVQDFYPTPSTKSTCMFYTGIDPDTMQSVYIPRKNEEKKEQRALLQSGKMTSSRPNIKYPLKKGK